MLGTGLGIRGSHGKQRGGETESNGFGNFEGGHPLTGTGSGSKGRPQEATGEGGTGSNGKQRIW